MAVIDRVSKYGHFLLIKHHYSAGTVAEILVKEIAKLHGVPTSIVSDRDPTFISHFWQEYFCLQGTKLRMSLAYHPENEFGLSSRDGWAVGGIKSISRNLLEMFCIRTKVLGRLDCMGTVLV